MSIEYHLGNPDNVLDWSIERYEEAIWRLIAKIGVQQTAEEVEAEQKTKRDAGHYLLGRSRAFWQRFVVAGKFDEAAALAKGYRPEQLNSIKAEMVRLKWM